MGAAKRRAESIAQGEYKGPHEAHKSRIPIFYKFKNAAKITTKQMKDAIQKDIQAARSKIGVPSHDPSNEQSPQVDLVNPDMETFYSRPDQSPGSIAPRS